MSRLRVLGVAIVAVLAWLATAPAAAQDAVHVIPEFTFESGQKLANMKVGYTAHGTLNDAKSNAILVTHGTGAGRSAMNIYIGPGKALDTAKYFVIAVDAIGGGLSSSPKDGLGPDFPRYTIRDMVRAQHDLVTRGLGLSGLVAVGGPSMGSFQALEWGINYPDFVKGLLLIVPAVKSDANVKMIVDGMVATVSLDPGWNGGRYTQNPTAGLRAAGTLFTPWLTGQEQISAIKSQEEYDRRVAVFANGFATWDAVSWMWRYLATREHDISKPFGGNVETALARIRAKALVMPSASDRLLVPAYAREIYRGIKDAVYAEIPTINGHVGYAPASEATSEYVFVTTQIGTFLTSLK
jgi:homoserine O-acetyltransferase/O-succinyltransferase